LYKQLKLNVLKKLFYLSLLGLFVFELLNVYFIMPLPGSQDMNSLAVAYFLYSWRWFFRILFCGMMVYGFVKAKWKRVWVPFVPVVLFSAGIWFMNFRMSADHMFYQPRNLVFADAASSKVDTQRLIIGIVINNQAKAYPIQFLGFHHIVMDTVGGKPVLVSYCTVCRTGRVFEPVINGKTEIFRLVGMDHFNAMFEDVSTKSWWQQATGEAVAGKLKGEKLKELYSSQTSLGEWLRLHPSSHIMQVDPEFKEIFPNNFNYESGKSKSELTGTDSTSWKDKSWVVGVTADNVDKAYDWNLLKSKRMIQDKIGEHNLIVILAHDNSSFFAFEINSAAPVGFNNDTIAYDAHKYRVDGTGIDTSYSLKALPASQEFWHSWRTFHPNTQK
jgi:Protein of unknown function (DUF3179)